MPDRSAPNESGGPRSFGPLFWIGAGLAPIAALTLLTADGTATLRIAAVLGLLAAVLIGLSSALRGGGRSRPDLAESLAGQRDEIRGEVRTEVAAGVQATHRMVAERLRSLHGEIEALRGQIDAMWAGAVRLPEDQGPAARFAPSADEAFSHGGQDQPAVGIGVAAVPQPAPAGARAGSGRATVPPRGAVPRPHIPTGVVRHTETVQVTTRHTIVEPDGDRADAAYGSGYFGTGSGWTVPTQRRRSADREPDRATGGHREDVSAEPDGSGGDKDAAWTGARDRWATVRDEDGGREIRMRQRRARVRADETGTELRIEDRWAAVREGAPDHPEARRGGGWRSAGSWPDERASHADEPGEAGGLAGPDARSRWASGDDGGDRWSDSGESSDRGDRWSDGGDLRDRWAEADGGGQSPDRGADPANGGWRDGSRDDQGRDDHGWHDQGWRDQGWDDEGWGESDQGDDGPASLDPAWGQRVPAALPAGSDAANSWRGAWTEPEREPVRRGHRYRDDSEEYGSPPSDGVPRAGVRQVGFERSDSRWG